MIFWLITTGEPLPIDGSNIRLLRTGILANLLADRGHDVVWWTSTFNHSKKKQRYSKDTFIEIQDNLKIYLLHSISYPKNISISRIYHHWATANKFAQYARSTHPPDIILCSIPTLELAVEAARYATHFNTALVVDIRDLWPDIFLDFVPFSSHKKVAKLFKKLFHPFYNMIQESCSRADAVLAITDDFVEWGLQYANRSRSYQDRFFPFGYTEKIPEPKEKEDAILFWQTQEVYDNNDTFTVCYFGSAGKGLKLEPVIEAGHKLQAHSSNIRIVLCGNHHAYEADVVGCENIIMPGWIGYAEIWTLMRISQVGLLPYKSQKDFEASIPNKVIEYMSGGLPILSSVKGSLGHFILNNDLGLLYDENDANSLVDCLLNLYNNRNMLNIKATNSYKLYKKQFVADKVYGDMISHLEMIVQEKKK